MGKLSVGQTLLTPTVQGGISFKRKGVAAPRCAGRTQLIFKQFVQIRWGRKSPLVKNGYSNLEKTLHRFLWWLYFRRATGRGLKTFSLIAFNEVSPLIALQEVIRDCLNAKNCMNV